MQQNLLTGLAVLIVDDDRPFSENLRTVLEGRGCLVEIAPSVEATINSVDHAVQPFRIAIVDLWLPQHTGDKHDFVMRGQELAYSLRKRSPKTLLIGVSDNLEGLPRMPDSPFSSFVSKGPLQRGQEPRALIDLLEDIVAAGFVRKPKCFIVHGHDEPTLAELRTYLRSDLNLGEPIVLRDRPALGKTIIESFEDEANVDIVFVLMTPDDGPSSRSEKRRSRQNVMFEMGFFYAKLQRFSGRIFLLKAGEIDLPSDISGVVYIDISDGLSSADTKIRRALGALGWL